jgi:hypothetical protein
MRELGIRLVLTRPMGPWQQCDGLAWGRCGASCSAQTLLQPPNMSSSSCQRREIGDAGRQSAHAFPTRGPVVESLATH